MRLVSRVLHEVFGVADAFRPGRYIYHLSEKKPCRDAPQKRRGRSPFLLTDRFFFAVQIRCILGADQAPAELSETRA